MQSKSFIRREEKIVNLLSKGKTYTNIGLKYGISKQRVYQIAVKNNKTGRWERNRKINLSIYKNLISDVKNKLSIREMMKKHSLTKKKLFYIFSQMGEDTLVRYMRNKRDANIIALFLKGETARSITKNKDIKLRDPKRLSSKNSIYRINRMNNIKRFPNIGYRCNGGMFETKKVLNFIVNKRDKSNYSFIKITDLLNKKGYRTINGLLFTYNNTRMKYYNFKKSL